MSNIPACLVYKAMLRLLCQTILGEIFKPKIEAAVGISLCFVGRHVNQK